jgi:hypothetical protein
MANAVKKFIDSVLFAGLKPRTPGQEPAAPASRGLLRRLWARADKWASGVAPDDPLYLSNRTWKQKLRTGLLLAVPGLLAAGGLALVFGKILIPEPPKQQKELSAAEIMSKVLPDVEKTVQIERYTDAEVVEVFVDKVAVPPKLRGKLQNNTDHKLSVELVVELNELGGARLGAVSARVMDVPARQSALFDFPLKSTTADGVLVREIRTLR